MTTRRSSSQPERGKHVSGEREPEGLGYEQESKGALTLVGNVAPVVAGIMPAEARKDGAKSERRAGGLFAKGSSRAWG